MHNGLTRLNTKKISGSDAATPEGAAALASVSVRTLIEEHGAELLRYLLLGTHYRRPIEFNDEVVEASKKGLAVFHRLFERTERLTGTPLRDDAPCMDQASGAILETDHAAFARDVLALKMKFLEMMDDDFNTAGAIAVLHELAGLANAFIEKQQLEKTRQTELLSYMSAAVQTLRNLGLVLGLFRARPQAAVARAGDDTLDKVMQLVIRLRADARASKNFALADAIRKGLAEAGVSLEDRSDGTLWRKN
jgi:cysteinyl-tRNA synthetase